MTPLQARIIYDLNVQPTIIAADQVRMRIDFLKEYLRVSGAKGFVLGISGGQDSTLAGRLSQLAAEELRAEGTPAEFTAVRLPYNTQADEDDAQLALSFITPDRHVRFNIHRAVDGFEAEYLDATGAEMLDFIKGNVKARSRMVSQYALAGQSGLLVVGTDHAAEAVTGFFTKFGDGGADILPLTGLTKRQGRALLEHLEAPERLYLKLPTADLLDDTPGQTDEANLGLSYSDIDDYLEGKAVPEAVAVAIETRYINTRHKRTVPVSPFDDWWQSE
ncbi:NH(3)-dependent NAD(+) synthetase [Salinibacterium xinjiangense]|uniref:NH(3)-dependent NAD(+) synthetase n=1 Tax=Salinibacterium xinjiangense TaxID=386302 RepID=A0A2C8ZIG9_9MICO|nr:ammonia-dependent NAD(+) synthetase [Salinibacterium xinjiangense]GGK89054.1 NH(3)-dependent NAD(+) synthetase [Salinibacterium xinjiangense]SOE64603.1 NH(3)-dependent NAD(+) synthetase [Salinibacterium xinjiangense]